MYTTLSIAEIDFSASLKQLQTIPLFLMTSS